MASRTFFMALLTLSVILISTPAHSNRLYSWKDTDGVLTFSDDPAYAPKGIRVEVVSEYPDSPSATEIDLKEMETMKRRDPSSRRITQGEFSLQLVKELGFSQPSTEKEAADLLTTLRIAPRLGQWELKQSMVPELTIRLRRLAVAAAEAERLSLTSDQVLLAFDTAAALLNLPIPVTSTRREDLSSSNPIAEGPPAVTFEPPPQEIYPAPTSIPLPESFWNSNYFYSAYFTFNAGHSFLKHHPQHPDGFDSGHGGNYRRSFIYDRPVTTSPLISPLGRVIEPLSAVMSPSRH